MADIVGVAVGRGEPRVLRGGPQHDGRRRGGGPDTSTEDAAAARLGASIGVERGIHHEVVSRARHRGAVGTTCHLVPRPRAVGPVVPFEDRYGLRGGAVRVKALTLGTCCRLARRHVGGGGGEVGVVRIAREGVEEAEVHRSVHGDVPEHVRVQRV